MRYYLTLTALCGIFVGAVAVVAWSIALEVTEYD